MLRIQQIASSVFGLRQAFIQCSSTTTLAEFGTGILIKGDVNNSHEAPISVEAEITHVGKISILW